MKTVTLDIDGVLNDYPDCWLEYISLQKNKRYQTIEEAKADLGPDTYAEIKNSYRSSGYKSKLQVKAFASDFTKVLKDKGYRIIVATSRPFHSYPELEKLTFDWLVNNNILFDSLQRKNDQLLVNYPQVAFHVDDELDHVIFYLEKNVNVFIVKRKDIQYADYEKYSSLRFVDQLKDILAYID